jgi:hypothetical protein
MSSQDEVFSVVAIPNKLVVWLICYWQTLAQSVTCYLYYKCYLLPQNKMIEWHVCYRLGNIAYWTCPINTWCMYWATLFN